MKERIDAMISHGACTPRAVIRAADELDADPWLLNVQNGVLDLKTGALLAHDRARFLLTKISPTAYDPGARCPEYMRFVTGMFPNTPGTVGFLFRFLGCCLTGDISEQVFPILQGEGGNGKNVLLNLQRRVVGPDFIVSTAPNLLTDQSTRQHPTQLADLRGCRLAIASETEEGTKLNVPLMKQLTGDPTIKARRMREDFFEFRRTSKLILVTNKLPVILENSEAVWRRIRLLTFRHIVPADLRDPALEDRLAGEAEGILALLVAGCLEWQAASQAWGTRRASSGIPNFTGGARPGGPIRGLVGGDPRGGAPSRPRPCS